MRTAPESSCADVPRPVSVWTAATLRPVTLFAGLRAAGLRAAFFGVVLQVTVFRSQTSVLGLSTLDTYTLGGYV